MAEPKTHTVLRGSKQALIFVADLYREVSKCIHVHMVVKCYKRFRVSDNKYALVSISDKTDFPLIGRGLQNLGYVIISTRGTASALESAGVSVTIVKDLRVFPEILYGRENFLDLNVYGGRLARRDQKHHKEALDKFGIGKIDVVVANVLPEKDISIDKVVEFEDGTDNVDGRNFTITAAVKNFEDVLVVVDPEDYPVLLEFLKRNQDNKRFRMELASKAFKHIIASDYLLAYRVRKRILIGEFPRKITLSKNPHQKAAFCVGDVIAEVNNKVIDTAIRHHGKVI